MEIESQEKEGVTKTPGDVTSRQISLQHGSAINNWRGLRRAENVEEKLWVVDTPIYITWNGLSVFIFHIGCSI